MLLTNEIDSKTYFILRTKQLVPQELSFPSFYEYAFYYLKQLSSLFKIATALIIIVYKRSSYPLIKNSFKDYI